MAEDWQKKTLKEEECAVSMVKDIVTMNDMYGDGSDHEACDKCGFCIECGDCNNFGCGKEVYNMPAEEQEKIKLNHLREK